jgi:hypothetical protein
LDQPQALFLLSERNAFNVNDAETLNLQLSVGLGINLTKNIFLQGRYILALLKYQRHAKLKIQ